MTDTRCVDILRRMSRFFRFIFKALATLFGVLALLVMIGAWRIATWASTARDVTPYIQSFLAHFVPEVQAQIGQSSLVWDDKKQSLTLVCHEANLTDLEGKPVASLKELNLRLRLWGLIRGHLLPQELSAQEIKLWLVRDASGAISSGLHNNRSETETAVVETLDFLLFQAIVDEISNEKLRHSIEVNKTEIIVQDQKAGQDWTISAPSIKLVHDKKESNGAAKIELAENGKTSTLQVSYLFDFEQKLHRVKAEIQNVRPSALAARRLGLDVLKIVNLPVSGYASLTTDRDFNVSEAALRIEGGAGFLESADLWDKPRAVEKINIQATYDRAKDRFHVPVAEINFGGPRLNLTLDAKTPPPKDLIWLTNKLDSNSFTVNITMDDVPMDQFASIWPKPIIPDARNWIVNSLSKGIFTHGDVTIRGRARLDDLENAVLESGGGKVAAKDGQVNYLEGMPIIENASAEATFDLEHMDVKILSGNTAAIKIKPFTLVMDHFQEDVQYITIPIQLAGPVPDVLRVLDSPPLGYAKEMGLDPNDCGGQVEGTLTLHMPLLDALLLKDVEVKANAKITEFSAKKLVPQIGISKGAFSLDLTKNGFDLKGSAALNDVLSQVVWKSNFGVSEKPNVPLHDALIIATVKGDEWGRFYGLDSLAKIQGETPVTINYTNVKAGLSKVVGQVGLKQAAVQLKDIGWNKPVGEAANLAFTLEIPQKKNMLFKSIDLQGQGIKVKGTAELDEATGKLVALNFKPFVLGRSNAEVSYLKPVDQTRPLSIRVEGESFDLYGMEEEEEKEKASLTPEQKEAKEQAEKIESKRPKDYTLQLQKLHTSEDGFLGSVKGHALRDEIGWKEIDLWGVAQGSTPLTVKLLPDNGRLAFNMNADNFGMALQGLGFGGGVKGGNIAVSGESSIEDPRTVKGVIKIESFVVSDLPVLARLLSAVSPFGFVDLITGDASFDKLRAEYSWHGDDVDLKEVRAAGSVVGINLNGRVNANTGQANLNGTLVPFSFMNSIIGSIPLLGDVITGGSGQGIIAASFTVKGNLSDPEVSVNPVSLLTPGFLRNIFFAGEDTKSEPNK